MPLPFRFDGKNAAAQRAAERQGSRFVAGFAQETRAALRTLVARAIRDGIPPYDAARLIESLIGLSERQALAVYDYREQLINSGLPIAKVDREVERLADRKLRDRAETIARTEVMSALNRGAQEAAEQAKREGLLGNDPTKEWLTTPDERLCEDCAPMDGVQVPLHSAFNTPVGLVSGPPLHPRCRCTIAVTA